MAEVESVMLQLIQEFPFANKQALMRGEITEIAKVRQAKEIILKLCVSEMICTDESIRPELLATLNEMRVTSLFITPCLKKLEIECVSGNVIPDHNQVLECVISASEHLKELLEEAAGYVSPQLLDLYYVREQ